MTDRVANADPRRAAVLMQYEAPLLRYAARLTGDAELAREIVQDTFVRWCERERGKPGVAAIENQGQVESLVENQSHSSSLVGDQGNKPLRNGHAPWLFAVCRNRALDVLRRRRGRPDRAVGEPPEAAAAAAAAPPENVLEQADEHARVLRALAALPARQQEIVRLKFQAGLSYREIAEVLGLTPTNVGFVIHMAIKALREELGD